MKIIRRLWEKTCGALSLFSTTQSYEAQVCKLHPICDASFPPHNSYEAQDKYVDSTQYVMEKRPGESRDGDPGLVNILSIS